MGIREDTETNTIQLMEQVGTGEPAILLAWGLSTLQVLTGMDLDRYQQVLAMDLFTAWTAVQPLAWRLDQQHVFPPDQVGELTKMFSDVEHAAIQVNMMRVFLQHRGENLERDQEILMDARTFCHAAVREADELSLRGIVTCERETLIHLIYHIRRLLHVVMGDAKHEEFNAKHAEIIAALQGMAGMANAPEV